MFITIQLQDVVGLINHAPCIKLGALKTLALDRIPFLARPGMLLALQYAKMIYSKTIIELLCSIHMHTKFSEPSLLFNS